MNLCKQVLSLAVPSFVSNFNSSNNWQTLIVFDLYCKSTSKLNKLTYLTLKSKLSPVGL